MEHFVLSRFWSRVGAFIIDALLLGILGSIMLWLAPSFFHNIGSWGRLLGWPVALVYFGVCNSRLAGGQTFGKRIMRIEVADTYGELISVSTSFKRAFVFTAAYFLVGIPFFRTTSMLFSILQSLFVLFNIGIVLYYIFNRETRQSLHDLAAGTFVVQVMRQEYEPEERYALTKKPLYIWGGTVAVLLLFGGFFYVRNRQVVDYMRELQTQIQAYPQVRKIKEVGFKTTYFITTQKGSVSGSYYEINLETNIPYKAEGWEQQTLPLARQVVQAFLATNFVKRDDELLVISISSVADIGIAKSEKAISESHYIAQWRTFAASQD